MELAKAAAKAAKGGRTPGLLADAADEAMFAAAPNGYVERAGGQYAPQGLLSSQPARPSPQDPPKRDRVSGWRVFDRVLGGQTVSEGLDAERARMAAEAQRPLLEAQKAETLASITDPTERALFMQAPDVWAENAGHRLRPRTLAPGSVERVNGKTVGAAPIIERVDDRFGIVDPLNPASGAQYTDPRGATFAEETGRINATNPVSVAPGNRLTDPYTGRVIAEGADRVFSAGKDAQLYTEGGGLVAENTTPREPSKEQVEIRDRIGATQREIVPTLSTMRSLLGSGNVITGFGANARLQAARAAAALGDADARRKVAATEQYMNLSGQLRVGMAKSLGANPSNADILLLEKITAGDIGQNEASLSATLTQAEERANGLIQDLTAQMGSSAAGPSANAAPTREALLAEARKRGLI